MAPSRALPESEERLRRLIEGAPDAIVVVREGRVTYANAALRRLLGTDAIVGRRVEEFVHADDVGRLPVLVDATRSPSGRVRELRLLGASGEPVVVECAALDVDLDDGPSTLIHVRDLTERLKMHSRLLQHDRLVSLGTLAAGVAHEIINPLAYLMANLDVSVRRLPKIAAELGGEPTPAELERARQALAEVVEMLQIAREGAERIRVVVGDMKTLARSGDLPRAAVDLGKVLASTIQLASSQIRHRARLVTDVGPSLMVDGDEGRIGRVCLNLLMNAAQSIPEGNPGEHEIHVATGMDDAGNVRVTVSDTGAGIAPKDLDRVFDPFFTTRPDGTGLGLSLCHAIVTSLGGRITVESAPGQGTRVEVMLPPAKVEG